MSQKKNETPITTVQGLKKYLLALDDKDILSGFKQHSAVVKDYLSWAQIGELIPTEQFKEYCIYSFFNVLKNFTPEDYDKFVMQHHQQISDIHELIAIFPQLSETSRLEFMLEIQDKFTNRMDYIQCLRQLSPADLVHYMQISAETLDRWGLDIVNLVMITKLPLRWSFISLLTEQITALDQNKFIQILKKLPDKDKLKCLKVFQKSRDFSNHIVEFLNLFDKNKRFVVAHALQNQIKSSHELTEVMFSLPPDDHLDFIALFKKRIKPLEKVISLLTQCAELEWPKRMQIVEIFSDQILNTTNLINIIQCFPEEAKKELAELYLDRIKTITDLCAILKALPAADRVTFLSYHYLQMIQSDLQFKAIQRILQLDAAKEHDLAKSCSQTVYFAYCVRKHLPLPLPLDNAYVQQSIHSAHISGFELLINTAIDPSAEDDYITLLQNRDVDLLSHDQHRGKSLATMIQESSLTPAEQSSRLRLLYDALENRRQEYAREYLSFNLSRVNLELIETFPIHLLPPIPEVRMDTKMGIDPEDLLKFERLLAWLMAQDFINDSDREYFENFKKNEWIDAEPKDFPGVVQAFEAVCCRLQTYLSQGHTPRFNEEVLLNLSKCSTGMISALNELYFSLGQDLGSQLSTLITAEVQGVGSALNQVFNIPIDHQAHIPRASVFYRLGIAPDRFYKDDLYSIDISLGYVDTWTEAVCLYLDRASLIHACCPLLPLRVGKYSLIDSKTLRNFNLLLTMLRDLRIFEPLPENPIEADILNTRQQEELLYLLDPSRTEQDPFEFQVLETGLQTVRQMIATTIEQQLITEGYLDTAETEKAHMDFIWHYLTTAETSPQAQAHWVQILRAHDGLAMIRRVMELHAEEAKLIRVDAILGEVEGQSLFNKMMGNHLMAEWFLGFTLQRHAEKLTIVPRETQFHSLSTRLMQDSRLRWNLEKAFHQPGNLVFWLYFLQRMHLARLDERYPGIYPVILMVIQHQDLQHCDSILQVLRLMQSGLYGQNVQELAQHYLQERLMVESKSESWNLYWKTAWEITAYQMDWTLLASNLTMRQSLSTPENAQLFLAILYRIDAMHNQPLTLENVDALRYLQKIHPIDCVHLYLSQRLQQTLNRQSWDLYWQTAEILVDFKMDWAQLQRDNTWLASLIIPENAKLFLSILKRMDGSEVITHLRSMQGPNRELLIQVMNTLLKLEPHHKLLRPFYRELNASIMTRNHFFAHGAAASSTPETSTEETDFSTESSNEDDSSASSSLSSPRSRSD